MTSELKNSITKFDMQNAFIDYLKKYNYKQESIDQIIYLLEEICTRETIKFENLDHLIGGLITKYDQGGTESTFGLANNKTALNSLKIYREFNVYFIQIVLLNKVVMAYNLLFDLRGVQSFDIGTHLEKDTQAESYRMLITNYICVLTGKRKNDKISISKFPPINHKKEVICFYNKYKVILQELEINRDQLYAHFDHKIFSDKSRIIEFEELTDLIQQLIYLLDYGAPIELKRSMHS